MKSRPILMSAPMVCALLDGRKTQTRRIVKDACNGVTTCIEKNDEWPLYASDQHGAWHPRPCPYGKPGDLLWVRETFSTMVDGGVLTAFYKADDGSEMNEEIGCTKFKPSIHMPRWASRLTLEITDIRVEQLQDISEADKQAEGATDNMPFGTVWKKINITEGIRWDDNPWVWVIEFKVHQKNVDAFRNSASNRSRLAMT